MSLVYNHFDKFAAGKIWSIGNGPKMKGHMHELPAKCFASSNDLIDRSYSNNKHVAIDDIADDWDRENYTPHLFLYKFLFWHNFKLREDFWYNYITLYQCNSPVVFISLHFAFSSIFLSLFLCGLCVHTSVCECVYFMHVSIYIYMFAYFFRAIWIRCRQHDVFNLSLQYLFSMDKDIFLCNYNTVIKIKISRMDISNWPSMFKVYQ